MFHCSFFLKKNKQTNKQAPRAVPSVLVAHLAKRQIVWVHKIVHIVKKVRSLKMLILFWFFF